MIRSSTLYGVDRFDLEYPEEVPDRLQWLEDHLRISRRRLLRLMGVSGHDAATLEGRSWREITPQREAHARLAEGRLAHHLSYFQYDPEEAVRFTEAFPERVRSGEIDLGINMPLYQADAPPAEREQSLVATILEDRSSLLAAMALFLSQPDPAV